MVHLLEDLNQSMATNTDILVSMSKENGQRHIETKKSFETLTSLLSSSPCKGEGNMTHPSNQPSWRKCYCCWDNTHFIGDCEPLTRDIAEGKIEARARIDSEQFPKEPVDLSPKDRVNEQWNNRTQFLIEDLPEDGIIDLAPSGPVNPNLDGTPFYVEDLPEDGIIDLMPDGIVTLQYPVFNLNARDKRDILISELQEKDRCAAKERDMWKELMTTTQSNVSVPISAPVPQSVPQPTIAPAQAMEFMTMLANMMKFSTMNSQSIEKGLQDSQ